MNSDANIAHAEKCVAACAGLPVGALDGGWTALGMSSYTKHLEDALNEIVCLATDRLANAYVIAGEALALRFNKNIINDVVESMDAKIEQIENFPPVPEKLLWMVDGIDRKEATKMIHDYASAAITWKPSKALLRAWEDVQTTGDKARRIEDENRKLKIALKIKEEEHACCADDLRVLAANTNSLLHQIDIGDFMDSNGHSAKMLKATHDLMQLLTPNVE